MLNWEFVQILRLCDEVYVVPPGKIDLQWVIQKCPQSQINWDENCFLDKVHFPSVRDACGVTLRSLVWSTSWHLRRSRLAASLPFRRSSLPVDLSHDLCVLVASQRP
jgi:hypothetical protein